MSVSQLTLIPASAGSGKTFRLKEDLKRWVMDADSGVTPEGIVAVTFTEAAAAELRQRLRGGLLQAGRLDDAARMEEAYIATIHGFGARVLRESAFDLGTALSPRLLTEAEQLQLLRQTLGRASLFDGIAADLHRFGYRYDFASGQSPEATFRNALLSLIGLLRSTGEARDTDELIRLARQWIARGYGQPHPETSEELAWQLRQRVEALLQAFPESLADSHGNSKTARQDLARDFDNLQRAGRDDSLMHDWALWKALGNMRISKRGCALPDEYDALAGAVMECAAKLDRHAGPLATAQDHLETLVRGARQTNQDFTAFKRQSGLVDYSDMVAEAYQSLRDTDIGIRLRERIDCLVIDEFQDTNPIQFGLLWQLIRRDLPTVIVGDTKQSIMGFQGADARLFEALVANHPEGVSPLPHNWRSQPALLNVINAFAAKLFPDYSPLTSQGSPSRLDPLHVLAMPDEKNIKTHPWRAARIAEALAAKLADPEYRIADRHTKAQRRLRGGDCAVLCPTHAMLAQYADALRAQGLRVRLRQTGWMTTTEIRIALQALALANNPDDVHARLYLAVTALGSHDLQDALRLLVRAEPLQDAAFRGVLDMAERVPTMRIDQLVPSVLRALGLYDAVACWPDARQARANVLKLEGLAQQFVEAQPESLLAAGIHGYGIPQFISWVHQQANDDDSMPSASVIDEDAVDLVTWHAAKGREWPLVAVCGLAQKAEPGLPSTRLEYPDFSDLDRLVESAELAHAPSFDGDQASDRFKELLRDAHAQGVLREIYVAITRPRDQLLLEWPLNAIDGDPTTRASLFQDRIRMALGEKSITLDNGEAIEATVDYARAATEGEAGHAASQLPAFGRRALQRDTYTGPLTADSRAPSQYEAAAWSGTPAFEAILYADPLVLPSGPDPLDVGNFVHRAFEIDDTSQHATEYLHRQAADLWPEQSAEALAQVREHNRLFEAILHARFGAIELQKEVPVIGMDRRGSIVNGVIDLLGVASERWLIIDHKTDRTSDLSEVFKRHREQLALYKEALPAAPAIAIGINAVMAGALLLDSGT